MSSVYLIRHGQAGSRQRYDQLSDVGRRQSRLLGEYLAAQKLTFAAIYSGALRRQRETASEVLDAYGRRGFQPPAIVIEPDWDEFDLGKVYESVAPRLSAEDAEFRESYQQMISLMPDERAPIHRQWVGCDIAVVRAWIEGRYPCPAESWETFQRRIACRVEALRPCQSGEAIAIFSSATPIAIWAGMALGLANGKVMQLAGVMYNSAITSLRIRQEELRLFSFNGVPHLPDPALRTFR